MKNFVVPSSVVCISLLLTSASLHAAPLTFPSIKQLKEMTARFAPVEIKADLSKLPPQEVSTLAKLVEAAKVMDTLFLRQVWAGNETMLLNLVQDRSDLGRARLHAFLINKGPWSLLDLNRAFLPGAPEKPS